MVSLLHMNQRISIAGLISATLLVFPVFAFAAFDVDLKYGDTGSEVAKMQQFLAVQGHFTAEVTGNFYAITLAAVQAFQAAQDISPISGYWGPRTRAKANAIVAAGGSTGSNVSTGGSSTQSSEIQLLLAQIAALQAQIAGLKGGNTTSSTNASTNTTTNTSTGSTNTSANTTATAPTPQTFEYLSSFHSGPQNGSDQSKAPYFGQDPSGPWLYGYSDSATGATKFMSFDGTNPSWIGPYDGWFPRLYNWGGYVHGSPAVITWVSLRAGTVTISGSVSRQASGYEALKGDLECAGATPIVVYVYQDGKALWSANFMPGNAGKTYSLSGTVNPGSNVSFIMQPLGSSPKCAIVYWNPTVVLK